MVYLVNEFPLLVLVLVYHWLSLTGYVSSMRTSLRLIPQITTRTNLRRVILACEGATNVGETLELFLERRQSGEKKYVKQFTVDGYGIFWSESSIKSLRLRSNLSGNVTATGGSFRIGFNVRKCSESATFRCVTAGSLRNSTSPPKDFQVIGRPQSVYISQTASLGSKYSQTLQPSSRVFYRRGDDVKLVCSGRLGEPLSWTKFNWYKIAPNGTKIYIVTKEATRHGNESSSTSCKLSRGFCQLTYSPQSDEIETEIYCGVKFQDETFLNWLHYESSTVTLYVYGKRGQSITPNEAVNTVATSGYSLEILIAAILGSIAGVLAICALVWLILRAYGYRCTGPTKGDPKPKISIRSENHMDYIAAKGGHPAHISGTENTIYESIDQPTYNSDVDSHGYLDLNNTKQSSAAE